TLLENCEKLMYSDILSVGYVFISHRTEVIFVESIELVRSYKMIINHKGKYCTFKISSILYYPKTTKNLCKLTLLTDSFQQFDQNQSVTRFVSLFEVHITFGFESEVPALLIIFSKKNRGKFKKNPDRAG